jgi:hypothetical protein
MTRTSLVLSLLTLSAWGAPTVSNISTVRKSHSTVTLRFDMSSIGAHTRVRYGLTTSYDGAGAFPDSGVQTYNLYDANASKRVDLRVTGLSPSTTYHFCPQVSDDGGSSWSTCVDHTETTDAIPAGPHPAYPTPPTPVDTTRPDTTGYTTRNVASNCSDLQTHINNAATNQYTAGSIIVIPKGTICIGIYTLRAPLALGIIKTWTVANVDTTTNRVTITGHGLSDNDYVMVASPTPIGSAGSDTVEAAGSNFPQHRGIASGNFYYVRVHDANTISFASTSGGSSIPFTTSTFTVDAGTDTITVPSERFVPQPNGAIQVISSTTLPAGLFVSTTYYVVNRSQSNRTFKLSLTPSGSPVDITDTGTGTHSLTDPGGNGKLVKLSTNKIIIKSDSTALPPVGVRITPEWQSEFAIIRPSSMNEPAIYADDLAHNYRFEGIEFTHSDTATAEIATTINPRHWWGLMQFQRATSNIIIDRCYIHGLGAPNRILRAIVEFNGSNSAIINSHLSNLDYWSPTRSGLTLTRNSNTQFALSTGTFHIGGSGSRTLSTPVTVNLSGTASGTVVGRVYLSMAGTLTLDLPLGISAICIGASCSTMNSTVPSYPINGDGGTTVMPIGNLSITGSALTAVSAEDLDPSNHRRVWEGAAPFIAGDVGGRTALLNNYISLAGTGIFYEEANGNQNLGTDFTIYRNLFTFPESQISARPGASQLRYYKRQSIEFKNGERILIKGNIFEHVYADVTSVANAIAISATGGHRASIADVEVSYNIFRDGSGTYSVLGGRPAMGWPWNSELRPAPAPLIRTRIHNNISYNNNQYTWRVASNGANAPGNAWDHRYAIEDLRIEHNTYYDTRGALPTIQTLAHQPIEGLRIADNIIWLNAGSIFGFDECVANTPSCAGDGFALLEDFSSDYVWTNNSIIAGWTDETGATARSSKTYITNALTSGTDAYLQSEWTTDGKWYSPTTGDMRLSAGSTHLSGGAKNASDGASRGADADLVRQTTGEIYNIRNNSTTVMATVPDPGASCYVGRGASSNPTTWTWTAADTSATRTRSITASGLTSGWYYRVVCDGTYQPASAVAP